MSYLSLFILCRGNKLLQRKSFSSSPWEEGACYSKRTAWSWQETAQASIVVTLAFEIARANDIVALAHQMPAVHLSYDTIFGSGRTCDEEGVRIAALPCWVRCFRAYLHTADIP
jgi:hypothetical protein